MSSWEYWKGNLHIDVEIKEMTTMDNDSYNEIGALDINNLEEAVLKFLKYQLTHPMQESDVLRWEGHALFSEKKLMRQHYSTYDKQFSTAFIIGDIISFTRILYIPHSIFCQFLIFLALFQRFFTFSSLLMDSNSPRGRHQIEVH